MIIEIQYDREDDFMERVIWETSKTIVDNLNVGEPYGNIDKVISINILYFNLGRGKGYIYRGKTIIEDLSDQYNEKIKKNVSINDLKLTRDVFPEYYFIMIDRFHNIINGDLDEWIYLFKNSEIDEKFKAKHIDKVQEKLSILKMSPKEKQKYDIHIKEKKIAKSVIKSAIAEGEAKGKAKGRSEGKAETIIEIAKSLIAQNIDIEIIEKTTKLNINEIQSLITEQLKKIIL
ncbi:hypothetical protein AN642_02885 [Epulopiscium sp. SCG-B10WGA-EpuloA2]|nr:hypothetical protein AN642_02885 [Epulopiscium sp. SCG-B10WGA-EpuloA2]